MPGPAPSDVQPTVRTRKNVPMNSVNAFCIRDPFGEAQHDSSRNCAVRKLDLQLPRCIFSIRAVATRASSEQVRTIVTSTSAPAQACRCQSSYADVA